MSVSEIFCPIPDIDTHSLHVWSFLTVARLEAQIKVCVRGSNVLTQKDTAVAKTAFWSAYLPGNAESPMKIALKDAIKRDPTPAEMAFRYRYNEPAQCHKCHACHANTRPISPSAMRATPNASGCHQAPRLPRKKNRGVTGDQRGPSASQEPAQCHKCHACHANARSISPSIPRFPRQMPLDVPSATPTTQKTAVSPATSARASPVPQLPRLPRKRTADLAKCHACHAKTEASPSASQEPAQCHKCHACSAST